MNSVSSNDGFVINVMHSTQVVLDQHVMLPVSNWWQWHKEGQRPKLLHFTVQYRLIDGCS